MEARGPPLVRLLLLSIRSNGVNLKERFVADVEFCCMVVCTGVVVEVLMAEKAMEDFQESAELKVFLRPLDAFSDARSAGYHNPPPSLASSFAATPLSMSGGSTASSSTTASMSIPSHTPGSSRPLLSPRQHVRLPSKSDAVRKLIEENRLAPHIGLVTPQNAESDASQSSLASFLPPIAGPNSPSRSPLAPHGPLARTALPMMSSSSDSVPAPFFGPSVSLASHDPSLSHTTPVTGVLNRSPSPLMPSPPVLDTNDIPSSSYIATTPPNTPSLSSSSSSLSSGAPSITHGYSRRGRTTELSTAPLAPSSGFAEDSLSATANRSSSSSTDSKAAGIRLRKAYDNVTVDEVLSDPKIQLAPTTHKDVTLEWDSPPKTVLIIKKRQDPGITELLKSMAAWLQDERGIVVLVEPCVLAETPDLTAFSADDPSRYPDIVICLGGDGTVLHANTLFQSSMPPVMAFNLGSLGFLTPFRVRKYKQSIAGVLSQCRVTLRSRLFCIVVKNVEGKEQVTKRTVLNEVVVDRGYSPYLSNLECFCDNLPITNIQADGIIVSSTTGSTAYSLSAGGSMVHPSVPAILMTPICPHSLSFRPLIFPDSVELKIQIPFDSRSTAWASFDGREQTELHRGDHLIIRVSKWPFVWIRDSDGVGDWFKSLADCLHWNDRRKQKSFNLSALGNAPTSQSQTSDPSPSVQPPKDPSAL